jgi:hypothetical protein
MTDEMRGPALVRDDAVTNELRAIYAAPSDAGYWDQLEQRILSRLERGQEEGRWWALSERAYRYGMMAAGLILILAGSVYLRSRAVESQMAYESVIETPGADQPVFARRLPLDERRATLRAATGH